MRNLTVFPLLTLVAAACSGAHAPNERTASQSATAAPGTTAIVAKHSGKCLDVRGGPTVTASGAPIEQWTCTGEANQAWTVKALGGGVAQIIAASSGKCLDVANGATDDGAAVVQNACGDAPSQRWTVSDLGGGYAQLVAAGGRCLDVTGGPSATDDGALAELWDCSGEANQAWALNAASAGGGADGDAGGGGAQDAGATPPASDGPIVASHSGKCLDVRGGPTATADGAALEQWTCSGEANQTWTVKDMGGGRVALVAKSSGKCADAAGGATANGTAIQQAACSGADSQLWTVKSAGSGLSALVHAASGRCLDVTGGPSATGDGALTELWDCTGQANQAWSIGGPPPASNPPPGAPPPSTGAGPLGQDASLYTLTFDDEFDGTSLDTTKWIDHLWYQPADPTPNYVVSDGSLKIFPVAGTAYTRDYRHITTDGPFYQTYGFFEMQAKLPYGKGPWPAFWLYNHDDASLRPEIDIMEAYSGGGPSSGWSDANLHPTAYGATIWTGAPGEQGGYKMIQTPDLSADWHTYAVKWEANQQTFFFDGQEVYSASVSMGARMYILLSFQFGSASGDGDATTPTGLGNAYDVRYVRAWQMK